jgi:hypothetical protein
MLIQQFESYIPTQWYDDGVWAKSGTASEEDFQGDDVEERAGDWTDAVNVSVGGAALTVHSIVLSAPESDSSLFDYRVSGEDWPNVTYAEHSPSATNRSFSDLFAQFRNGVRLIQNEEIRLIAKSASVQRHRKPDDSWPKKLANDVKDADD